MTENTIELNVEGESIEVEVEELSALGRMRWAAKAPDALMDGDPYDVKSGPEIIDFMVDLATSQTVITEKLLEKLDEDTLGKFLGATVAYAFGEEPDIEDEPRTIDFNSDGSVDLDDWE